MTTTQVSCTRPRTSGRPRAWHYIGLGSLCGLAWAAGLRGFMAQVAGSGSEVEWAGAFAWILAPGVATGAMLGLAEWLRRTGGRRGWRWLAASPLAFAAVFLSDPLYLGAFFATGIGGGDLALSRPRGGVGRGVLLVLPRRPGRSVVRPASSARSIPGEAPVAWLLPAVGFVAVVLAASTWASPLNAAMAVSAAWLVTVWLAAARLASPATVLQARIQVAFLVLAGASFGTFLVRRRQLNQLRPWR